MCFSTMAAILKIFICLGCLRATTLFSCIVSQSAFIISLEISIGLGYVICLITLIDHF